MLDALTLDQVRTFIAVAEAGTFRAGAIRLSRAQSAVSHAIGNLEAELGLALFDRSKYRTILTPAGRTLLAEARAILIRIDRLRARARGLGEGVEIELSLVVDVLFPLAAIGEALRDLHEAYPTVAVRLSVVPLGAPLAALREGRCVLAITVGEWFRDPRIEIEALSSLSFVAVAGSAHALAQRSDVPLDSAKLADHLQIVLEDPSPLTEGQDFGVLSPGTWRVSGQDVKHCLILAGVGWGRLPLWLVERDLAEGRLIRLDATALGRQGEAVMAGYLAHRTDVPLGPAARVFRAALLRCVD
ncbi:MAG: LysR family transcriptional regulator [Rhizobiales bacterium]|nr:LysR family transcriptional regulator [Hyphomicrobiales bacterium]